MQRRSDIPRELERDILMEAGHRCAVPTCRHPTTEVAHIIPYAKVRKHEFHNLIALCPNCHDRYDRHDIDRKSMKQYKANLSILNNRYGDLEKRVLTYFAEQTDKNLIKLSGGTQILVMYLIKDGYLKYITSSSGHPDSEFPNYDVYELTSDGREFVQKWISGLDIN